MFNDSIIGIKKVGDKLETKVIVICNNKGGVGKSTCTAAIADILARKLGRSTLIIDADPQGNLSGRFGFRPEIKTVNNSLDVYLYNELNVAINPEKHQSIDIKYFFSDCKQFSLNSRVKYENLKIIPASSSLERIIAAYMASPQESDGILRKMMRCIKETEKFAYVLIDTQPNLSYFLKQIMMASDYVIVPVEPVEDAFNGAKAVGHVFNSVAQKKSEFKNDDKIDFLGVFFNKWRKGTVASKKFELEITQVWKNNPVFETKIPMNQDAVNAANLFAPITTARPSSTAAKALEKLTKEMVNKIG